MFGIMCMDKDHEDDIPTKMINLRSSHSKPIQYGIVYKIGDNLPRRTNPKEDELN